MNIELPNDDIKIMSAWKALAITFSFFAIFTAGVLLLAGYF
jgi:hypothetical protein